jgi:hypothetical protein
MAAVHKLHNGPSHRAKLESTLDRLLNAVELAIAELDSMDDDPDLEDSWDREPHLGWPEAARAMVVVARSADGRATKQRLSDPLDQTRFRHDTSDLEDACEDEGAQCDDEGVDTDREPNTYGE